MNRINNPGIAASLLLVASFAIIAIALAFEHLGGYTPCPLCLQQRWAYYFAIPAAAIALFFASRQNKTVALGLIGLIGLAFLYNAGLGIYHAGAEWKFWPGPETCGTDAGITKDAGSLLEQLKDIRVIRCDEAPWRFLGISFAGYNAIFSAFLTLVAAAGVYQQARQSRESATA